LGTKYRWTPNRLVGSADAEAVVTSGTAEAADADADAEAAEAADADRNAGIGPTQAWKVESKCGGGVEGVNPPGMVKECV